MPRRISPPGSSFWMSVISAIGDYSGVKGLLKGGGDGVDLAATVHWFVAGALVETKLTKRRLIDQVQGCMWITGRKWWHIGMYCPLLKPVGRQLWLQEFKRDDGYFEKLEEDLWQFKLLVDGYEEKLRSKAA